MRSSAVGRGAPNKFIVGDTPKGSYEASDVASAENAMAFSKRAGTDVVKLEGGQAMAVQVNAVANAGILVFGHIGLTPP